MSVVGRYGLYMYVADGQFGLLWMFIRHEIWLICNCNYNNCAS
jgi:hypothetical protein